MTFNFYKSALLCATLSASLLALTSCQDEEFGYSFDDVRVGAYNRNFAEVFGVIDPAQTWNTASQVSLDVNICFEGEYTIKVYTANPRYPENNAYLAGQYDNMTTGQHQLRCDLPTSVEYAYIGLIDAEHNRMILPAQVVDGKASVTFGSDETTRSVVYGDGNNSNVIYSQGDIKLTTLSDINTPLATLPEHKNNTGKVSQNFEYVSMGEFEIYPIYTITSNKGGRIGSTNQDNLFGERLGIYTYDKWGNVVKDSDGSMAIQWIWHMNRGTIDSNGNLTSGCWYQAHKSSEGEGENSWHDMYWFENNIPNNNDATLKEQREQYCIWKNNKFKDGYDKIRTYSVKINITKGTRFGFVLETDHGNVFSNSTYNLDQGSPTSTVPDHMKDTYAATFHTESALYLAFEDWGYNSNNHDNDFNDLVLKLQSIGDHIPPLIIDKDTETSPILYIVACEDLGGTFDWDFNDVVFGIEHVSGQTQARVKLLAAGGTLPISLSYDNPEHQADVTFTDPRNNQNTQSLHAAFGAEDNVPVNVITGGFQASATYSDYFRVDADAFSVLDGASDFKIHVEYGNKEAQSDIHVPNYGDKTKFPQAFLISDPRWQWPAENQNITSLYPDFATWVSNFNGGKNWTNTLWGTVREVNSIPSYAHNLFNFQGAVTYSNNVATIKLEVGQMKANTTYKLAVLVKQIANAQFWYNNGTEITDLTHGEVPAAKLTTFTIPANVIDNIRATGADAKATLTFSNGINADGNVLAVYWYEAGQQISSNLIVPETNKTINLEVGDAANVVYTTENPDSPVLFRSSNDYIASVDATGKITANAVGEATITISQAATEHYRSATQTVTVTVEQSMSLTEYTWSDLTKDVYHRWSSVDANSTQSSTSPGFDLYPNGNNGSNYGYGSSAVNKLDYAKLDAYDVLRVKTPTSSAGPRLLFNRQTDGSDYLEITFNASQPYANQYIRRTSTDTEYTYFINLKAIRKNYGYVHINCIKAPWGGTLVLNDGVKVGKE